MVYLRGCELILLQSKLITLIHESNKILSSKILNKEYYMSEIIDITVNARVKNGPAVGFSNSLKLDAYDKLKVVIPASGSEDIQLVPVATNIVQCMFIKADRYSTDITYDVNGAGNPIILDTPQSYIGQGAVSVLDTSSPSTLNITNNLAADDVTIEILVGRSAVV